LEHLKDDSLAKQLVQAHRSANGAERAAAMKEIIERCLKHARECLDGNKD
jgi:hypothetical protein